MEQAFVVRWAENCRKWKKDLGPTEVAKRVEGLTPDIRARIVFELKKEKIRDKRR